jgi:hypothetical protein
LSHGKTGIDLLINKPGSCFKEACLSAGKHNSADAVAICMLLLKQDMPAKRWCQRFNSS